MSEAAKAAFGKWETYVVLTYNVLAACMAQGLIPDTGRWHTASMIVSLVLTNVLALVGRQVLAPRVKSRSTDLAASAEEVAKPKARKAKKVRLALVFFCVFPLWAAGCACWGDKKDTKACIVARAVVNCAVDSGKALAPSVAAEVLTALQGGAPDWDALLGKLETVAGFGTGLCILAELKDVFTRRLLAASPGSSTTGIDRSFAEWKAARYPGVKVKLPDGREL